MPAAVIGTVGTRVAGTDVKTALTTPEAPDLHGLFAMMRERGVEACAMEVSSHALVMGRVDGVVFDVAVFTNLGRDHLDFHADVEDYFAAKASLFTPERARRGLVNVDDAYGRRLLDEAAIPVRTFSATGRDADWRAVDVELDARAARGSRSSARTAAGSRPAYPCPATSTSPTPWPPSPPAPRSASTPARVAAGHRRRRRRARPARARSTTARTSSCVVDYAHKPDAVEAALRTLRPLTDGRVIVVIGAGGDRDPGKRPMMGEIAARLADVLVVTDDNPRSEDPAAIRQALLDGAAGGRAPRCSRSATGVRAIREAVAPRRPGRHRARRRQGTRGRPGGRRRRAPVRRPRRRPRGAGRSMIPMTLAEIAAVVGGAVDGDPTSPCTGPAFVDSREVVDGGLFVAVAGERVDGHEYAAAAVQAGAAAVLGSRPTGVPTVVVDDPVDGARPAGPPRGRHDPAAGGRADRVAGQDRHQGLPRPRARRASGRPSPPPATTTTRSASHSLC